MTTVTVNSVGHILYSAKMKYVIVLRLSSFFTLSLAAMTASTIRMATGSCVPNAPGPQPQVTQESPIAPLTLGSATTTTARAPSFPLNRYILLVKPRGSLTNRALSNGTLYVGPGGRLSTCGLGDNFALQDNQLKSDDKWLSTSPVVASQVFAVSPSTGYLSTNFSIVDGYLNWSNSAFQDGLATFCTLYFTVFAVFQGPLPDWCLPVNLLALSAGEALPVDAIRFMQANKSKVISPCNGTNLDEIALTASEATVAISTVPTIYMDALSFPNQPSEAFTTSTGLHLF